MQHKLEGIHKLAAKEQQQHQKREAFAI